VLDEDDNLQEEAVKNTQECANKKENASSMGKVVEVKEKEDNNKQAVQHFNENDENSRDDAFSRIFDHNYHGADEKQDAIWHSNNEDAVGEEVSDNEEVATGDNDEDAVGEEVSDNEEIATGDNDEDAVGEEVSDGEEYESRDNYDKNAAGETNSGEEVTIEGNNDEDVVSEDGGSGVAAEELVTKNINDADTVGEAMDDDCYEEDAAEEDADKRNRNQHDEHNKKGKKQKKENWQSENGVSPLRVLRKTKRKRSFTNMTLWGEATFHDESLEDLTASWRTVWSLWDNYTREIILNTNSNVLVGRHL
jgi:hypothetical protein